MTRTSRSPQSIVLVHGAWHGSWCWQRVIPMLERRGFAVRAVDLPSTGIDCDPETQRWAIGQLRRQPAAPFAEPVAEPSWLRTNSTYIVCTQDHVMPVEVQRELFAPRAGSVFELEASHSPFLSCAVQLAERLAACGQFFGSS